MIIPYIINKSILTLYQSSASKSKRNICAENFEWDKNIPIRLREQCIQSIARNWSISPLFKEIPQLADRLLLLDFLATDLQLDITVPIIHEDVYWKRCYEKRWPKQLPENNTTKDDIQSSKTEVWESESEFSSSKTWKQLYLEMHLREFLEHLPPEEYEPENVQHLSSLCAPYISKLHLSQLQCSRNSAKHIPFSLTLSELYNLKELSLTFQQKYVKDAFSWKNFKTSFSDIQHLCKAFEKIPGLKILKISRSDIDCEKFTLLLKSLLVTNNTLKEIDFFSCNISDEGVKALCNTFIENNFLEKISLANNKIGLNGAKAFSQIISQRTTVLKYLDLRLNYLSSEGGQILFDALAASSLHLRYLILAGCGFKSNEIRLDKMLQKNDSLQHLDLSNNRFGEDVGKSILKGLEENSTLTTIDLRMCDLSAEIKYSVKLLLERNRKATSKSCK